MDATKVCSICENIYWGFGNNAWPVNEGRCCDSCNWTDVIPARLKGILKPEKPKRSPMLNLKLTNRKYQSWKSFLDSAYWNVELK